MLEAIFCDPLSKNDLLLNIESDVGEDSVKIKKTSQIFDLSKT